MPKCKKCLKEFKGHQVIDGKGRNLYSRIFCLECSPWKKHNTTNLVEIIGEKKKCTGCDKWLDLSEFYCYGISCFKSLQSIRQREQKQKIVEYMGGKCCICGYAKCLGALEFHHKNPKEKDPTIRFSATRCSLDKIKVELDKCIIVCCRCHREIHCLEDEENFKKTQEEKRQVEEQKAISKMHCCDKCGIVFEKKHKDQMYCSNQCYGLDSRKVERPTKDELEILLWQKPTTHIAKQLGISDKAIEKWAKDFELEKPPRGYWAKKKVDKILPSVKV